MQANDLRKGNVISYNNEPCLVMEVQHRTPGNLRAFVQAKLRNLRSTRSLDVRFGSTDTIELLSTDRRTLEFSYMDGEFFNFIDTETYESIILDKNLIGDAASYLVPNGTADILFVDGRPVQIELPPAVSLKIIESADGIRGDTASNVQKPAKLETGLVVQVPLFVKEGEVIKVSTTDGTYMSRA